MDYVSSSFEIALAMAFCFRNGVAIFAGDSEHRFSISINRSFFYVACLTPSSWPVAQQLAAALMTFTLAGYLGMLCLVAPRFGVAAGTLAGTFLLSAPYTFTELYLRGDFSEYAGWMLVPGLLAAILRFSERPSRGSGIAGAALAASVVMTHPAVALATYGLLAMALIVEAGFTLNLQRFSRGALLLTGGVGFSAVYWLPVFLEGRYASVEKMWNGQVFDGYYHFSRHFVSLTALLDQTVTQTPIPVKLGLWQTLVSGLGLLVTIRKWTRWNSAQSRQVIFCVMLLVGSLFLMTPHSIGIWEHLPLLGRIQFPWRLLTLVTFAMAGIAGVAIAGFSRRGMRLFSLALFCGLLIWPNLTRSPPGLTRHHEPRFASEIADQFVAPDLADEWLPRGAQRIQITPELRKPMSLPPVTVHDYRMKSGCLECELQCTQSSAVILPHYYFPIGFVASLAGQPVLLERTPRGLMKINIPAGFSGTLRVVWRISPAKKLGIIISLVSAFAGAVVLCWKKRTFPIAYESACANRQPNCHSELTHVINN